MGKLRDVQGHQRAAAFLLSLEPDTRAVVLGKMSPDVVESVSAAMIDLDPRLTESGVVELLKSDLARSAHSEKTVNACDETALHELLTSSIGRQRGDAVLAEIARRRDQARPFRAVESFNPFDVGLVLRRESAAVAAVVLAHLDPAVSANVLRAFDSEDAIEVVKRIATLETPQPAVMQVIAANIVEQLESSEGQAGGSDPSVRLKIVADLLNNSGPEMEKGVIESIAADDDEMAKELREFMFTWADIATIDTRTMQKILGTVDTKTLSLALKGSDIEIEENVLGNLSERVRDMVAEERELAGAVPMNEVMDARNDIMNNVRAMIEAGEFRPSKGGEELVT